jgi:hypothetical protein
MGVFFLRRSRRRERSAVPPWRSEAAKLYNM